MRPRISTSCSWLPAQIAISRGGRGELGWAVACSDSNSRDCSNENHQPVYVGQSPVVGLRGGGGGGGRHVEWSKCGLGQMLSKGFPFYSMKPPPLGLMGPLPNTLHDLCMMTHVFRHLKC